MHVDESTGAAAAIKGRQALGVMTLDDVAKDRSRRSDGNAVIEIQPGFYLVRTDLAIAEGVSYSSRSFPFAELSILLEGRIATDAGLGCCEWPLKLLLNKNYLVG